MSYLLKQKHSRALRKWEAHKHVCPCCFSARSAATLCSKGQGHWLKLARIEIDIDRANAKSKGVTVAVQMAGGAR
jgi:hypothetical protein